MPRFSAYKSLFKISGWDEWKVIFCTARKKAEESFVDSEHF